MKYKILIALSSIFLFSSCKKEYKTTELWNALILHENHLFFKKTNNIYQITEYNNSGNLNEHLQFLKYYPYIQLFSDSIVYQYNDNGTLYRIYDQSSNTGMKFQFSESGLLLKIYSEPTISGAHISMVYKKGELLKLMSYNDNMHIYSYNDELTEMKNYTGVMVKSGGSIGSKAEDFIGKWYRTKNDKETWTFTKKDEFDHIKKTIKLYGLNINEITTSDNTIISYKYDNYNNPIEIKLKGNENKTYSFNYKYNAYNDWIKRTIKLNEKVITKSSRKIKYYKN